MLSFRDQVRTRGPRAGDSAALATVFRDSWNLAYRGIIPDVHLDRLIKRRDEAWWSKNIGPNDMTVVLEVAGQVAGYATYGPSRAKGPYKGEIYELYLAPPYQGLGLGEHLFEACRHRLDLRSHKGLVVWALIDNTMACNFYWRRGGRPVASVYESFGTKRLEKAAFVWQ